MQFVVSVLRYYCGMNGYFPIPRLPDTVFSVPQRHMWEAIANFMMCPFHSDPQTQTATANNVGLIWSIDHNSIGFKTSHIIISQSIQRRSKAEKKKKTRRITRSTFPHLSPVGVLFIHLSSGLADGSYVCSGARGSEKLLDFVSTFRVHHFMWHCRWLLMERKLN